MKREELAEMGFSERQIEEILKADILEWDNGDLVGWGSHKDYDYYALEVMNGDGYYDSEGHFHRYSNDSEI